LGGHGGQAADGELDRQPPGPGDGLVPGQVAGPGLQLAGDQRQELVLAYMNPANDIPARRPKLGVPQRLGCPGVLAAAGAADRGG
jgi:hypothetical protein